MSTNGDVDAFKRNWSTRAEAKRYHFRRGVPQHQVEYAFQNHWRVFRKTLGDLDSGIALEVGAGRGSMGAHFANGGYEVHLLDTSADALKSGCENFSRDGLHAHYTVGDALHLPYAARSVDVIVTIGLLEHFESIREPIAEQIRVLRPRGMVLNYIVPERRISVQTLGTPVNLLLRLVYRLFNSDSHSSVRKSPLYRNKYSSAAYLQAYRELGLREVGAFGMFPVPIISHSPAFPFTPMSPPAEKALLAIWRGILGLKAELLRQDPWICPEWWGLAFLAWGTL